MIRFTIVLTLLLCFSNSVEAQCECSGDKRYTKLIESGLDKKKNDLRKRIEYLNDAIELDEDCKLAQLELGKLYFKRAKASSSLGYGTALKQFQDIAETCPEFHSDVFYYMGVIAYSQEEWSSALESFDRFLAFPVDDPTKLARDFEDKRADVDAILVEVQANADLYDNPVSFNPSKVKGVSTAADEYLPMMSPDNEQIFYTRKYERKAKGDLFGRQVEEFTTSSRPSFTSEFNAGKPLPAPFNVGDNYGGATISVNNKEMLVTVCKPIQSTGYNNCDIYVTRYSQSLNERTQEQEFSWGELENLGAAVNTKDGWEAQPSLSADGNTLYFATARENSTPNKDGNPSIDIYYSLRSDDGSWGKARSIGETINGPGNEKSPFMHGDSRTLYYSTDGDGGVGGYDIYFCRSEEGGTWSEPKNIGTPINTVEDEHGLIVSTDGSLAYYATSKLTGAQGFDIYSFEVPAHAKPDKVVLVRGALTDEDGEVVTDARIELNYVDSRKVTEVKLNQEDGTYATIINVQKEPVVMTVEKEGHAFQAQLFTDEDAAELVAEVDMEVKEVKVGKPYTIDDIYYTTASAEIDRHSKLVLDEFAAYLLKQPSLRIAIYGHTDNVGGVKENETLSTERAFEVMTYLQEKGIPASALSFKGYGSSKPIADNGTAEGRALNRRTEFVVEAK